MAIDLPCPACQKPLTVPDSAAGCTGKCPFCGVKVRVPDAAAAPKICRICKKDLSGHKRVKDPAGRYSCPECYADARQRKTVAAAGAPGLDERITPDDFSLPDLASIRPVPEPDPLPEPLLDLPPASAPPPAPAEPAAPPPAPLTGEEMLLADEPSARKPAAPSKPAAPAPASAPQPLPDVCPACQTPVLKKDARLCVRCGRDLTQLAGLQKLRAATAAGPSREEKVGSLIGKTLKVILWAGLAAALLLGVYVVYTMFVIDKYSNYPTARAKLLRDFFGFVAQGTNQAYVKAWGLVSLEHKALDRQTLYTARMRALHQDFAKRYGENWIAKLQIDPMEPEVDVHNTSVIRIDGDAYHVQVTAQVSMDRVLMNASNRKTMREDGKICFGISEVEFYEPMPPRERFRKSPSEPVETPDQIKQRRAQNEALPVEQPDTPNP